MKLKIATNLTLLESSNIHLLNKKHLETMRYNMLSQAYKKRNKCCGYMFPFQT